MQKYLTDLGLRKITVGKIYAGLFIVDNWRATRAILAETEESKPVSQTAECVFHICCLVYGAFSGLCPLAR